jgi:hypothetical protein
MHPVIRHAPTYYDMHPVITRTCTQLLHYMHPVITPYAPSYYTACTQLYDMHPVIRHEPSYYTTYTQVLDDMHSVTTCTCTQLFHVHAPS